MQDFTCSPYGGWVYFTGGTRMWVIPDREFMLSRAPEEMAKDLDRWIKEMCIRDSPIEGGHCHV